MDKYFDLIRITRNNFISLLNNYSLEEINHVPAGFANNMVWNFGHIIVAPQGLCYRLSSLPTNIDDQLIQRYKKGSKPEAPVSKEELDQLISLATSSIDQLENDYKKGLFKNTDFTSYTTSFNNTVSSVEDSIAMIQSHDAMHFGYALAIRRALSIN